MRGHLHPEKALRAPEAPTNLTLLPAHPEKILLSNLDTALGKIAPARSIKHQKESNIAFQILLLLRNIY